MPAVLPAFFLAIADSKLYERKPIMAEVLHKRGDAAVQLVPNSLAQTKCMLAPMNNPPDTSRWVRGVSILELDFPSREGETNGNSSKEVCSEENRCEESSFQKTRSQKGRSEESSQEIGS